MLEVHKIIDHIVGFRIVGEIIAHPKPLSQSLVVNRHLHLTCVITKALRVLTL
jgi:hypothetical protein